MKDRSTTKTRRWAMRNSLLFSVVVLVASLFCSSVSMSQKTDAGDQSSPENLAQQWRGLPAETQANNLEKLIAQYRGKALSETDVELRNQLDALLSTAVELKADPANDQLLERFFSFYLDNKRAKEATPFIPEKGVPGASVNSPAGGTATTVTIRPKDLPYWTGTIHSSWFDGYVKSDWEIWAGENIVATHFRGWVVFDISTIPANATIISITLNAYTSVSSNSSIHELGVCALVYNCDPRTATGQDLYARILSGPWFNSVTNSMQSTGPKTIDLNAYANADLQNRIGRYDWWALGIVEKGDNDDWGVFYGHDNALHPTCTVMYVIQVGIDETSPSLPTAYRLEQNYPNPFNPSTTIRYELPKTSEVRLGVYDMLGHEVSVLEDERRDAGIHEVRFDASGLSSGVYMYRLQAGEYVAIKRMLVLK
jgi:hypothetical protein